MRVKITLTNVVSWNGHETFEKPKQFGPKFSWCSFLPWLILDFKRGDKKLCDPDPWHLHRASNHQQLWASWRFWAIMFNSTGWMYLTWICPASFQTHFNFGFPDNVLQWLPQFHCCFEKTYCCCLPKMYYSVILKMTPEHCAMKA